MFLSFSRIKAAGESLNLLCSQENWDLYMTTNNYCLDSNYLYAYNCYIQITQTHYCGLNLQYWCLSLLVEIQLLDINTHWHVMSVLPVESLVPPVCSGWDLVALPLLLLVETLLWAVHHPTLSPSTHCASPILDGTLAKLLLVLTLEQPHSWWTLQVHDEH